MALIADGAGSSPVQRRKNPSLPASVWTVALRLLLWLAPLLPAGGAAAGPPTEYEVKAAFLLNFTKFVTWPAGTFSAADSPIVICIHGKDPFGNVIDAIVQGETVDGRKIAVRRIAGRPDAGACQIVYTEGGSPEISKFFNESPQGLLTVGEGDPFARAGGMIAFVLDRNHVRFLVNLAAADRAGIKLSSRLLNVAKRVEQ